MAFKMKGPTFFNVGKKGEYEKSAAFQHYVDDVPEHNEPAHSDDLQSDEEHKSGKVESKGGEDRTYYNALVAKEKVGPKPPNAKGITKSEQSALDRLRSEEGA